MSIPLNMFVNRTKPFPTGSMRLQTFLMVLMVCLGSFSTARAADDASDFEQANKFYEQGKYADAISAYDKLLQNGKASEAIYFNRGNAYFKTGELGRAI